MTLLPKLFLLVVGAASAAPAGDFNSLVREFSRQTGAHETKIPFFGLARFVVSVSRPVGASDLKLAVFENVNGRQGDFMSKAEGIVNSDAWKRIVRVRSRGGEATNIYAMQEGKRLRMLVATVDKGDAVFLEVRIKPEELARFVDEHKGTHHN